MNPWVKYTLGRVGLFLVVLLAVLPFDFDLLLKLMIAIVVSFALAYFLLRGWRDEVVERMAGSVDRRRAERERLRSALAGDESGDEAGTGRGETGATDDRDGPDGATGDRDDPDGP